MSSTSSNNPSAMAHTTSNSRLTNPDRRGVDSASLHQGPSVPLLGAAGQRRHRRRLAILSLLCLSGVWISLPNRGPQTPGPIVAKHASAGAAESSTVMAAEPAANSVVQTSNAPIARSSNPVAATRTSAPAPGHSPPGSGSTTIATPEPRTPVPSLRAHAPQAVSPTPDSAQVVRPIPTEFRLPKFEPAFGRAKDSDLWWKNSGTRTETWQPGNPHPLTPGIKPLGALPHDFNRVPIRSFERRTTGLHPPIRPTLPSRGRQGRR